MVRTSVPVELISMISWPAMTCSAATVTPLRSVVCSAITPWPPRPCEREILERGELAVAGRRGGEHVPLADDDQRDQVLVRAQADAAHAGGLAAHRAHFVLVEADRLAAAGDQDDLALAVGEGDADQPVVRRAGRRR